mgnify:CR=1 FL=1|jgi:uncharacterized protein YggE
MKQQTFTDLRRYTYLVVFIISISFFLVSCSVDDGVPKNINESDQSGTFPVSEGNIPAYGEYTSQLRLLDTEINSSLASQGIWVSGSGIVKIEPDIAAVAVSIEVTDKSVSNASDLAARSMRAVLKVLRNKMDVEENDISTSEYTIQTAHEPCCEPGYYTRVIGYTVTNGLKITIRDLDNLGQIIDEVIDAGGNNIRIDTVSFEAENMITAESEARKIAVIQALNHATEIAEAAGVNVGRPFFITESSSSPASSSNYESVAMTARSMSTPIQSGELNVIVTVQARFLME